MKTEHGWAIVGRHGLYIGWWQRRGDAIAGHIRDVRHPDDPETSGFYNGRLTEDQSTLWQKCQRRGDRAVRITLTY